jgi:hypothetical protein
MGTRADNEVAAGLKIAGWIDSRCLALDVNYASCGMSLPERYHYVDTFVIRGRRRLRTVFASGLLSAGVLQFMQ